MSEMKNYYFTEEPFQEAAFLDPYIKNDRLNGKVFSMDGFKKPFTKLLELIERKKSICYLTSDNESRGTGKSALLAAVYWDLTEDKELSQKYLPLWITVRDYKTVKEIIGRILDQLIEIDLINKIAEKLGDVSPENIEKTLKQFRSSMPQAALAATSRVLTAPKEAMSTKFINIKRSYPSVGTFDIFEYILHLITVVEKRRLIIFVDQFEEFIQELSYSAKGMDTMAAVIRDIYRTSNASNNVTFILTLHPKTQNIFESAAAEILSSYGQVPENSSFMESITEKQMAKIAVKYMTHYRMSNKPSNIDEYHPFTEDALEYLAKFSKDQPRTFIRFCYNTLMEAIAREHKKIDTNFIKEFHEIIGLGVLKAEQK